MVDLANYSSQLRDKEGLTTATINHAIEIVTRFFVSQEVLVHDQVFSKIISWEEIASNDYNLSTARYFAAGDKTPKLDKTRLSMEISQLENGLKEIDSKIDQLKEQLKSPGSRWKSGENIQSMIVQSYGTFAAKWV